jgi:hypothetical protein
MWSTILSQTRATRNATVLIVVYYNEAVSAETGSPDPSPRLSEDRSAPGGVAFFPWGRFGCVRTEPGGKSRVGRKTTCDSPGPSRSYARRIGSINRDCASMPTRRHYRRPNPDRCRALELLAGSRYGYTKAILRAHGFSIDMMVELVKAGLATTKRERIVAGGRQTDVVRVRITDAGRQALAKMCK